jgi:uncharacterized protein
MPEYLAPGVYVEEISAGPKPIEGVSTSTAAFLGPTERGPETPQLMLSWLDYQRTYGGFIPDQSYLAYAVQGFFENGGKRCFVARVASRTARPATGSHGTMQIFALGRGTWGNHIYLKIAPSDQRTTAPDLFKLWVMWYRDLPDPFVDPTVAENISNKDYRAPDEIEFYDNLTHKFGASNNVVKVVNANSRLVRVIRNDAMELIPLLDAPQLLASLGSPGDNGAAPDDTDYKGDLQPIVAAAMDELGQGRGLEALKQIDEISLLCVPDEVHGAMDANLRAEIRRQALNQCEELRDRFAIFSVDQGQREISDSLRPPHDSSYGAFYYPWIKVFDPRSKRPLLIPPTGHIAGIYARTDIERGVHKAPANEVVRGSTDLEFPVPKGAQDLLNPRHVNCIRDFRSDNRGIRLWGARTMSSDPEWKYINVRRLFLFVEESIDEGVQWVVFEPNDEPTWARVRRSITNFLITVWRNGALMGATQNEAFFVKCDRTTMTEDDINNGRLICYIGIAPVRPAEFVIIRISQKTIEATG